MSLVETSVEKSQRMLQWIPRRRLSSRPVAISALGGKKAEIGAAAIGRDARQGLRLKRGFASKALPFAASDIECDVGMMIEGSPKDVRWVAEAWRV